MRSFANNKNLSLIELLLELEKIDKEQVKTALDYQKDENKKIEDILIEKNIISEDEIIETLLNELNIPFTKLEDNELNFEKAKNLPEDLAREYTLLLTDENAEHAFIAMTNPLNIFALDNLKLVLNKKLVISIATRSKIEETIDKIYRDNSTENYEKAFTRDYSINIENDYTDIDEEQSAPIIKLLDNIIKQAVKNRASDIHIEPLESSVRIRYRIDGELKEVLNLNKNLFPWLITRTKIVSKLNIAESRLPQDGRSDKKIGDKEIDMRISILPTIHGEKAVIRLLHKSFEFNKYNIGLDAESMQKLDEMILKPNGVILLTGPTGSGKTTTLYCILKELNMISRNIVTVEDPVEYRFEGINQVQLNGKAGLSFSSVLRFVLRQDPDIIMIGEIRDRDTADIAIRSAITGHKVFSTLHTNDSPSAVIRLIDMGIEPYLLSSALKGVISQRLIRKLCNKCKKQYKASDEEKESLGQNPTKTLKLCKSVGCEFCNEGFHGRIAIYEIMPLSDKIREMIDKGVRVDEIRTRAKEEGMRTLFDSAVLKVIEGETTFEEVSKLGYIGE